ncbi:hypothetical protein ALC53_08886 [Atta colombica]|uniref:Uncharacterized protein n=1 Tax=Atta colombica TaxID=520822 RepID=A0A195B910_9HYME|nr:hypothetical protein ALC53_08886 [Atta colombica]
MNISVSLCTNITSRKHHSDDIHTDEHQITLSYFFRDIPPSAQDTDPSRKKRRFHRLTLTRYTWGTHRPWAARGTGGTFQCDIRRRCAGAWARTDIRRAIWDWESPRPRAADSRCRARSLDAPPASRPDAKTDARQRLLCWSSMKADLPLWETGVLEVVLSPPLPPGGPGVTEPRPA